MKIRITQIDGKLPNLALMRLSGFHKNHGDEVFFTRNVERSLFEGQYDRVYGSIIFSKSEHLLSVFRQNFPEAIIGGSGSGNLMTIEEIIGNDPVLPDYSFYTDFEASIGYTQRGCRLKCGFCIVPIREGKPKTAQTIAEMWRGEPFPKNIHLLDNDFFGQPEKDWQKRIDEIITGHFRVCFSQGINIRKITDNEAEALASIEYRDTKFAHKRLYTAWDNLRDEKVFFEGVDRLGKAGIPPKHLMVYMLVGYDPTETFERLLYRFNRMVEIGILPYPMVYGSGSTKLKAFQRWVIRGLYRYVPFEEYNRNPEIKIDKSSLFDDLE